MMTRSTLFLPFLLPFAGLLYAAAPPPPAKHVSKAVVGTPPTSRVSYEAEVIPLLKKYCVACHSGPSAAAGIAVLNYPDTASVHNAQEVWERISRNIADSHMPPDGVPHPTATERTRLVSFVNTVFAPADCRLQDPGHVTMRRLNREEYNNTVRDLLGVTFHPADDFPNDDVGYGFDNIGDVLSISPLLMEKYLNAAEKVAEAAIVTPDRVVKPTVIDIFTMGKTIDTSAINGGRMLSTNGELFTDYTFPKNADYLIKATACQQAAGTEPAHMALRIDGKEITTFDVTSLENAPMPCVMRVTLPAGSHRIALAFTNDFYDPGEQDAKRRDRNLIINGLEISAPLGVKPDLSEVQRRLFAVPPSANTPDLRARKILANFASRAFRRPVRKEELDRLVRYVHLATKDGESFERGIQLAVEAVLVSPNFLFRVEADPNPNSPNTRHLLNDYELASRLSYFLWSSMPDAELFKLAANGTLKEPNVMAAQVRRMLKDPKAQALADNFAGQWLQLRKLSIVAPDTGRFPDFNEDLRKAMKTETEMFFESIVNEDRSVLEFLNARYTFLNGPLAKHYDIPGVEGNAFRRVTLASTDRGGLLTQASVLTVTSNPTRTSPVKRGKWVMEQLLGTPLPPPPPNVSALPDDKKGPLTGTLRQRMEQHRKNPICASCHARMDPIGFGLENFDAVGRWRTSDGGNPIDASGTLPDGKSFQGPAQLRAILLEKKSLFVQCLSEKLLTYALGRGLESYDTCATQDIVKTTAKNDYRFSALVTAIVQSEPFRKERGYGGLK